MLILDQYDKYVGKPIFCVDFVLAVRYTARPSLLAHKKGFSNGDIILASYWYVALTLVFNSYKPLGNYMPGTTPPDLWDYAWF